MKEKHFTVLYFALLSLCSSIRNISLFVSSFLPFLSFPLVFHFIFLSSTLLFRPALFSFLLCSLIFTFLSFHFLSFLFFSFTSLLFFSILFSSVLFTSLLFSSLLFSFRLSSAFFSLYSPLLSSVRLSFLLCISIPFPPLLSPSPLLFPFISFLFLFNFTYTLVFIISILPASLHFTSLFKLAKRESAETIMRYFTFCLVFFFLHS